jgi:hypothetical protein
MRRHEKLLRRAFLNGYRAGRQHRDRDIREVIDAELKQFEQRLDAEQKRFEEMLAATTRAALHRLQSVENAALSNPPRWLQ